MGTVGFAIGFAIAALLKPVVGDQAYEYPVIGGAPIRMPELGHANTESMLNPSPYSI